jgi:signal transduction histidine kinase
MSIVKEIMALHCGHMALSSEPGQGTTVRLVFPAGG